MQPSRSARSGSGRFKVPFARGPLLSGEGERCCFGLASRSSSVRCRASTSRGPDDQSEAEAVPSREHAKAGDAVLASDSVDNADRPSQGPGGGSSNGGAASNSAFLAAGPTRPASLATEPSPATASAPAVGAAGTARGDDGAGGGTEKAEEAGEEGEEGEEEEDGEEGREGEVRRTLWFPLNLVAAAAAVVAQSRVARMVAAWPLWQQRRRLRQLQEAADSSPGDARRQAEYLAELLRAESVPCPLRPWAPCLPLLLPRLPMLLHSPVPVPSRLPPVPSCFPPSHPVFPPSHPVFPRPILSSPRPILSSPPSHPVFPPSHSVFPPFHPVFPPSHPVFPPSHPVFPRPILSSPHPILSSPRPILSSPRPILSSPRSIPSSPRPILPGAVVQRFEARQHAVDAEGVAIYLRALVTTDRLSSFLPSSNNARPTSLPLLVCPPPLARMLLLEDLKQRATSEEGQLGLPPGTTEQTPLHVVMVEREVKPLSRGLRVLQELLSALLACFFGLLLWSATVPFPLALVCPLAHRFAWRQQRRR
ncbi:unnamed protein product [Closterium sp. NIES-64]|nr:unnamed protein product [Closterium sp. NIES-64]